MKHNLQACSYTHTPTCSKSTRYTLKVYSNFYIQNEFLSHFRFVSMYSAIKWMRARVDFSHPCFYIRCYFNWEIHHRHYSQSTHIYSSLTQTRIAWNTYTHELRYQCIVAHTCTDMIFLPSSKTTKCDGIVRLVV